MRMAAGVGFCALLIAAIVWIVGGGLRAKRIRELPEAMEPPSSPFVRWVVAVVKQLAGERAAGKLQLSMGESPARRRRLLVVAALFVVLMSIGIPIELSDALGWTK
jgi:hypothetical protein